jgi:hypothetical protein
MFRFLKFSEKDGEFFCLDPEVISGTSAESFLDIVQNVNESVSGFPGPKLSSFDLFPEVIIIDQV